MCYAMCWLVQLHGVPVSGGAFPYAKSGVRNTTSDHIHEQALSRCEACTNCCRGCTGHCEAARAGEAYQVQSVHHVRGGVHRTRALDCEQLQLCHCEAYRTATRGSGSAQQGPEHWQRESSDE